MQGTLTHMPACDLVSQHAANIIDDCPPSGVEGGGLLLLPHARRRLFGLAVAPLTGACISCAALISVPGLPC